LANVLLADPAFQTDVNRFAEVLEEARGIIRRWTGTSTPYALTVDELAEAMKRLIDTDPSSLALLGMCSPECESGTDRRPVAEPSDSPSGTQIEFDAGLDPFAPPTKPGKLLSRAEMIALFKDRSSRISYRQLYSSIPCSQNQLKKHLHEAGLSPSGVRLTNRTFTVAILLERLVPYLQHMEDQGPVASRILNMFHAAGQITQYRCGADAGTVGNCQYCQYKK